MQKNELATRRTEYWKVIKWEQVREKEIMQNKNRLKELNNSIKHNNIHIGVPEKEKRGQTIYLKKSHLKIS